MNYILKSKFFFFYLNIYSSKLMLLGIKGIEVAVVCLPGIQPAGVVMG